MRAGDEERRREGTNEEGVGPARGPGEPDLDRLLIWEPTQLQTEGHGTEALADPDDLLEPLHRHLGSQLLEPPERVAETLP